MAMEEEPNNRNVEINAPIFIEAWTKYNFDARNNKYSDFKWNWTHFHGVDWDEKQKRKGIFKFYGKHWDVDVDKENGNFDYLMGADVDFNNVDVIQELNKWGDWYVNTTNVDGFRLDAVKHIRAGFYKEWLENIKEEFAKDFFTVSEQCIHTHSRKVWRQCHPTPAEIPSSKEPLDISTPGEFFL